MIEILLGLLMLSYLNGLYIVGFYNACLFTFHPERVVSKDGADSLGVMNDTKMIFWKLRYYSEKRLGYFWSKPICTCVSCMGSLHSVVPFSIFCLYYNPLLLLLFPLYACTTGAAAKIIQSKTY